MKGWRKFKLNDVDYIFKVGKGSTVIRKVEGGSVIVPNWRLAGAGSPDDFERSRWKRSAFGSITPGLIRSWLEQDPNEQ